ncbi:hypothetical protein A1O3_06061 [Capronia epimyces CBS 606.96]|uniref:BZIP domain-containing protein n=1 Tax=Capronia epimyces CBS 606.96 TaxID=1182542 RepID=W9XPT7_9EURO|nr:uncharacterized protein A1O3_06061 [Capronia epimyces CBS 606.96]EXJ82248.1 hypothetical protein A1O3_06061 [Capronia epimyces CBS 606.96]
MACAVKIPDLLNPSDSVDSPSRRKMSVDSLLNPLPSLAESEIRSGQRTDLPETFSPSDQAETMMARPHLCPDQGQAITVLDTAGTESSGCPLALKVLTQPWSPTVHATPSINQPDSPPTISQTCNTEEALPVSVDKTDGPVDRRSSPHRHDLPKGTPPKGTPPKGTSPKGTTGTTIIQTPGGIDQGREIVFQLALSTEQSPPLVPVPSTVTTKSQAGAKRRNADAAARYRARKKMKDTPAEVAATAQAGTGNKNDLSLEC